jgi:hypothetical protein
MEKMAVGYRMRVKMKGEVSGVKMEYKGANKTKKSRFFFYFSKWKRKKKENR